MGNVFSTEKVIVHKFYVRMLITTELGRRVCRKVVLDKEVGEKLAVSRSTSYTQQTIKGVGYVICCTLSQFFFHLPFLLIDIRNNNMLFLCVTYWLRSIPRFNVLLLIPRPRISFNKTTI